MAEKNRSEAMRELGRLGGKASGIARRKRRSPVWERLWPHLPKGDAETLYERLLASPAGAVKLAAELGRLDSEPERQEPSGFAPELPNPGAVSGSVADFVRYLLESDSAAHFGLDELADEQRRAVLGRDAAAAGHAGDSSESRCLESADGTFSSLA